MRRYSRTIAIAVAGFIALILLNVIDETLDLNHPYNFNLEFPGFLFNLRTIL